MPSTNYDTNNPSLQWWKHYGGTGKKKPIWPEGP